MKRIIVSLVFHLVFGTLGQSQSHGSLNVGVVNNIATPYNNTVILGNETNQNALVPLTNRNANPIPNNFGSRTMGEEIIGRTTYDLQSNFSLPNRIVNHGNNKLSVAYTYSESYDLEALDRGTAFQHYNGTSWEPMPSIRIESSKSNWPSIAGLPANKSAIISESSYHLNISHNDSANLNSWNNQQTISLKTMPKIAVGGSDNLTIHAIALKASFTSNRKDLVYSRSLDGGISWDIIDLLIPRIDSTNFASIPLDAYAIQAFENTVAVAVFGQLQPIVIAKSTDNGGSWLSTTVSAPGLYYNADSLSTSGSVIGISDNTGDGIADTITGSDGYGALLIDSTGNVHLTYGLMQYLDTVAGDGEIQYFPFTNGLMYWNETMESRSPELIGAALDLDLDGFIGGVSTAPMHSPAAYYASLSSFPSMTQGVNGEIYVAYSAYMETIDQGIQNYRHIYITTSNTNGCSWTAPIDVTPLNNSNGFGECIYPAMANDVDSVIHMVYQRDFEPGLAVKGDEDAFGMNEIIYTQIPTSQLTGAPVTTCIGSITPVEPTICFEDTITLTAPCGSNYVWSTGDSLEEFTVTEPGIYSLHYTTECQTIDSIFIPVIDLFGVGNTSSPITASTTSLCIGDSAVLSLDSTIYSTFNWNTGDTTASITTFQAGVYEVTVRNCNGTAIESITITDSPLPDATIEQPVGFCSGDSVLLKAVSQPNTTYLWSTGSTDSSAYAFGLNTITLTVTNCSGSSIDSIAVTAEGEAIPTIVSSSASVCDSDSIVLTAGGGASYLWENGDTTEILILQSATQSGAYQVTVFNACRVGQVSQSIQVDLLESPFIPAIDIDNDGMGELIYSSSASTNNWYVNGVLEQSGGQAYVSDYPSLLNKTVYAKALSIANGCESSSSIVLDGAAICDLVSPQTTNSGCNIDTLGAIHTSVNPVGFSPFSYLWESGETTTHITGLSAGMYSLTVYDAHNCYDVNDIPISMGNLFVTGNVQATSCAGNDGSINVFSSGGTYPLTYNWSNGIQATQTAYGLTPGNYSFTVTDANNCVASDNTNMIADGCLGGLIKGTVYNDSNANGVQDPNESVLSGIAIKANNIVGYSNNNGVYEIAVPLNNTYLVTSNQATYWNGCTNSPLDADSHSVYITNQTPVAINNNIGLVYTDTLCGTISGFVFLDTDANGIQDSTEDGFLGIPIKVGADYMAFSNNSGNYEISVPHGTFDVNYSDPQGLSYYCDSIAFSNDQTFPANQSGYTVSINNLSPAQNGNDFGITGNDFSESGIYTLNIAAGYQPGTFISSTDIKIASRGQDTCTLTISHDEYVNFLNASILPDTVSDTSITWSFTNLAPYYAPCISMEFDLDINTPSAYLLEYEETLSCISDNDPCEENNTMHREVWANTYNRAMSRFNRMASYNQEGRMPFNITHADSVFSYEVYFQNTTSDTAFNLLIIDTLPAELDINSLSQPLASHPHKFSVRDGNVLVWEFENINLPDSGSSFKNSYGFVQYNIKMKPNLPTRTQILNKASIAFNYGQPINTNWMIHTLAIPLDVAITDINIGEIKVFPNPATDNVTFELDGYTDTALNIAFFDVTGKLVLRSSLNQTKTISLEQLVSGMYFYTISSKQGNLATGKLVVE